MLTECKHIQYHCISNTKVYTYYVGKPICNNIHIIKVYDAVIRIRIVKYHTLSELLESSCVSHT